LHSGTLPQGEKNTILHKLDFTAYNLEVKTVT